MTQEVGLENKINVASFVYDFSVDGGAIGDITLGSKIIPDNALIVGGCIDVITGCTSGGSATVALKVNTSEDILAATAVGSLTAGAFLDVVPDMTGSALIKTAAAKQLTMTIAVATLTAGKIVVNLFWVRSL